MTGIDDHSRYCVCAHLTPRATARPVCEAFTAALQRHGVPDGVLTDNGKVFTARFGLTAGEVLFDRLCREHGIRHLLTAPRSPTTTGKVERFHKTLRSELLQGRTFASLEEAQAALDAWTRHYNAERPHQGIGMAAPAERFEPGTPPLPELLATAGQAAPPASEAQTRRVDPGGRVNFEGHRYQVGAWLAGETVELSCTGDLVEVRHCAVLVASHVRRRPAHGLPVPVRPPAPRPETNGRSVVRKVDPSGALSFAGTNYRVGNAHRGEQVEVRLVGDAVEISKDGELLKSWPARHDRFKEHGAFATPAGRPRRSNASRFSREEHVTHLPEPMRNTGGET